ncbi:MAG: 4-hydroxythreonine-4-phosphate dehydrogenase PdxA [Alphaproteobacteria bacterium]|nr:4-hydroxythreonine-4-phosphate dehydrogenase PdxA [Alphaproteobacteria bacterium]
MSQPRPLVVTMGEPASIAAEITAKLWLRLRREDRPEWRFFVVGEAELYRRCGVPVVKITQPRQALEHFAMALPVLVEPLPSKVNWGVLNPDHAPATIQSIRRAVALVQAGEAAAVITNPIHKAHLQQAGFGFPGHTEFLESLTRREGMAAHAVMMLTSERITPPLRVVPITVHLALRDAVNALDRSKIITTAITTATDLRRRLGIANPRLAVAGLNPHAGENGTMGREEIAIIAPAIAELQSRGLRITGPYPADSLFHPRAREDYDLVLCPTHDQALIPLKTLDFSGGVNVTLGLDLVRTSPDHGTALDIAGKDLADETSLYEAVKLAAAMVQHGG